MPDEQTMKELLNGLQQMTTLLTKVIAPAPATEQPVESVASEPTPAPAAEQTTPPPPEPVETTAFQPIPKGKQLTADELPPAEELAAAIKACKNKTTFDKYARKTWGMARKQARSIFDAGYATLVKDVTATAEPTKVEGPVPGPAPEPIKLTVEEPIPDTVVALPEAAPVSAHTTALAFLLHVGRTAKVMCKTDIIGAIKYIREKTGYELMAAKLWTDMLMDETMVEPAQLTAARQELLRKHMGTGVTLDAQVQVLRKEAIAKEMDPVAGKAEGQRKIDLAGDNQSMMVQVARRIARDLAKNGPITIDDITEKMAEQYNVLPATRGGKAHKWKGSVFTKSEFAFIGELPSRQKSAHGRPVGLWALKSWLKDNTLNGKSTHVSSYVVSRLYGDFKRVHPTAQLMKCNCYIGEERLADEIRDMIVKGDNKLYEMPVTFFPGAVGALIMPPDPSHILK